MALTAAYRLGDFRMGQQGIHRDYYPLEQHSLNQRWNHGDLVTLIIYGQLLKHEARVMAHNIQQVSILAFQR